jgi:hypothetical protein
MLPFHQTDKREGRSMSKKRFFALSVSAAALSAVCMVSVAWAVPTSSHGGGANAVQIGVVRIDPTTGSAPM